MLLTDLNNLIKELPEISSNLLETVRKSDDFTFQEKAAIAAIIKSLKDVEKLPIDINSLNLHRSVMHSTVDYADVIKLRKLEPKFNLLDYNCKTVEELDIFLEEVCNKLNKISKNIQFKKGKYSVSPKMVKFSFTWEI